MVRGLSWCSCRLTAVDQLLSTRLTPSRSLFCSAAQDSSSADQSRSQPKLMKHSKQLAIVLLLAATVRRSTLMKQRQHSCLKLPLPQSLAACSYLLVVELLLHHCVVGSKGCTKSPRGCLLEKRTCNAIMVSGCCPIVEEQDKTGKGMMPVELEV